MATVIKNCFKNMEILSFLDLFPHFLVDVFEDVQKAAFKIGFGAQSLNVEQRSIILQTNNFPG